MTRQESGQRRVGIFWTVGVLDSGFELKRAWMRERAWRRHLQPANPPQAAVVPA